MAFLASDNTSGASAEIIEAITLANEGNAKAYGADDYTELLTATFREIFEHSELVVFPVFNGSAANCLSLASIIRPYEAIIAHHHSHLENDECGMPEFFTGGKILKAAGENGKIDPTQVQSIIELANANGIHHSRPKVISITQSTEFGTTYKTHEIASLSALAKSNDLLLHMDGARFANAVAGLGCKPADITWRAGIDVMSFGGTKNGALLAEAVIFFKPKLARDFERIRKRSGQLASKQRFISAQLLALLDNNFWINNATHANAMAARLGQGLLKIPHVTILNSIEANALFVQMPSHLAKALVEKDHHFYDWPLLGDNVYRLVTNFNTNTVEIDAFLDDVMMLTSKCEPA